MALRAMRKMKAWWFYTVKWTDLHSKVFAAVDANTV